VPSTHVIACATVIEEMRPLLPGGVTCETLDFGLHVDPPRLRQALQGAIDRAAGHASRVILGYGFCSMAVVGLQANCCTLVVPRVDDCIALFLGSSAAYKQQTRSEPGTYYLTKGWIEAGDTPFAEYDRLVKQYGPERAGRLVGQMLNHYTRLAFIHTGQQDLRRYRAYARQTAERFGLRFEEIPGSDALIRKALFGPWDGEFVIVAPGEAVRYEHFFPTHREREEAGHEDHR
jgi:hypothetical protein